MNQIPPEFQGTHARIGERITDQLLLSPAEITAFATLCKDLNPALEYEWTGIQR